MAPTSRGRGRPPAGTDTRPAILDAARTQFAEQGYDGVSVRSIAKAADVDPALVHHHFGTKEQLFVAAMQLPVDPGEIVRTLLAGDPDELGERIVRTFLTVWDSAGGETLAGLVRSAVSHEASTQMLQEFVAHRILGPVAKALGQRDAKLRATLAASQLLGLGLTRYILRLEPLASAPPDRVVAAVAPSVQRYLTGELG